MGQSSIVSTSTRIEFGIQYNPLAPRYYFDLAQCLSIVNRRSYRQGMNYAIGSIEVFGDNSGTVAIQTVPHTWVADNATTKAFEAWKDQRAEVLKEQPSLKAKWSDFKIYLDATHAQAGVVGNITPVDASGNPYVLGEWDSSQYVTPLPGAAQALTGDANEVTFHVVGDHIPAGNFDPSTSTSVGLIKAYAASRARVLAPDPVPVGQYISGFYNVDSLPDETQQDVMSNVANHNDEPPYSVPDYPGGDIQAPTPEFVDALIVRNWGDASTFSSDTSRSFVAPLGLVCLNINGFEVDSALTVLVNLVPGDYKGVLAERGL